jgi:hypothetical protein
MSEFPFALPMASGLFFDAVPHRESLRREVLNLFAHWHPMMDFSPTRRPAYRGTNIVTLPLSHRGDRDDLSNVTLSMLFKESYEIAGFERRYIQ